MEQAALEGWLYKKGSVNPAFKRRWFRLSNGRLSYYADQWTSQPKGMIALSGARIAALAQPIGRHDFCFLLACAALPPDASPNVPFAVPFSPGRGKEPEYLLAAPSFAERQAWLAELRKWLGTPAAALVSTTDGIGAGIAQQPLDTRPLPPLPPLPLLASSASTASDGKPAFTSRSNGRKFIRDSDGVEYELLEKLGEGATCKVKRCVCTSTGVQYALKILKKARLKKRRHFVQREKRHTSEYEFVLREIAIMKKLTHRHIVSLHDVFDDEERDRLYMLLDYMPGGQVGPSQQRIEPLPLAQARACARDVASGLAYLHHHNVVHRDIKPANILKSSEAGTGYCAIADFGVSLLCENGDDATGGNVGTLPFKPPEAHDARGGQYSGKAADVWSLGVTLFQVVYGELPFYAADPLDFGASVRDDPLVFPSPPADPRLEDLFRKLLCKDPAQRITAAEALQHPWLRDDGGPVRELYSAISVTSDDLSRALRSMLSFRLLAPSSAASASVTSAAAAAAQEHRGGCRTLEHSAAGDSDLHDALAAGSGAPARGPAAAPRVLVGMIVAPRRARPDELMAAAAADAGRRPVGLGPAASDDDAGYAEDAEDDDDDEAEAEREGYARTLLAAPRHQRRAPLGTRVSVTISVDWGVRRVSTL